MSFMRRIWNYVLRNPVRYAGRDLEGNTYFESKSNNDPSRTKRTVQYQDKDDMWKYIASGKRLPAQWSAWLTHTRRHPPTLQELEADLNRQRRVLSNALKIEARDRAEADDMKRLRQQGTHMAIEDAVNTRTERTRTNLKSEPGPTGKHAASKSSLETSSEHTLSKVLPPKFVTPAMSRKAKSSGSKPFPSSSPLDLKFLNSVTESDSEIQTSSKGGDESSPRNKNPGPSPWKTSPADMESWSPKTRKRG